MADTEEISGFERMQEEGCSQCSSEDTYIAQAEVFRGGKIIRRPICICDECGWAAVEDS